MALGSSPPRSSGVDCSIEGAVGCGVAALVPSPSGEQGEQAPQGNDEPLVGFRPGMVEPSTLPLPGKSPRVVRRAEIQAGNVMVASHVVPLADGRPRVNPHLGPGGSERAGPSCCQYSSWSREEEEGG